MFKNKFVLEALSERCSLTELARKYRLSPSQISIWKKEFLTNASRLFEKEDSKKVESIQSDRDELHRTIGEQKVEIDF